MIINKSHPKDYKIETTEGESKFSSCVYKHKKQSGATYNFVKITDDLEKEIKNLENLLEATNEKLFKITEE